MEFRDILKDLRFEKNVTQGEVAKSCGLTSTCICQLETGARNPTGSTVIALAKYFDVSADYLLGLTSDDGAGLYSPPTAGVMHDTLTREERELIESYRGLNDTFKKLVRDSIKVYSGDNELIFKPDKKV